MFARASDGAIFDMLLREKNISVKELAKLADIPVQTLYTLKRRNNNLTNQEVKDKLSKALDIPKEIWEISVEDLTLHKLLGKTPSSKKDTILNSENIKIAMQFNHITPEYIKYALDFIGYDDEISVDEIERIIEGKKPITKQLGEDIEYFTVSGKKIVSREELKMLNRIRSLSIETREAFYNMLDLFCDADSYRTERLNKWADELEKNRTST